MAIRLRQTFASFLSFTRRCMYCAIPLNGTDRSSIPPFDASFTLNTLYSFKKYRSDGVTLIGFDSVLQITLVVETLSF